MTFEIGNGSNCGIKKHQMKCGGEARVFEASRTLEVIPWSLELISILSGRTFLLQSAFDVTVS